MRSLPANPHIFTFNDDEKALWEGGIQLFMSFKSSVFIRRSTNYILINFTCKNFYRLISLEVWILGAAFFRCGKNLGAI